MEAGIVRHRPTRQYGCSPTYISWSGMKSRCDNPKDDNFLRYGARGITYAPAWMMFDNFLADMGERLPDTTLERIENNLGYFLENCEWGTRREQTLNRSITRWLTHDGRIMCAVDWAKELGVVPSAVCNRLAAGWTETATLTTPFRNYKQRRS